MNTWSKDSEFLARPVSARRRPLAGGVQMGRRHELTPGAPLSQEIEELHDTYVPRVLPIEQWNLVAEDAKAWLRMLSPTDRYIAMRMMLFFARLALWAIEHNIPLDPDVLFSPVMTDRFVDHLAQDVSEARAKEYRARIRRYGPALTKPGTWPVKSQQIKRSRVYPPLSLLDEDLLYESARRRGINYEALVVLGCGCGLDGRWLPHVKGTDVSVFDDWVYVEAPDPDARRIPARARIAADLLRIAETVGDDYLIGGTGSSAKNRSWYLARALSSKKGRRVNIGELRSTWFAAHLRNNTDLRYLRRISGVTSFNRLVEVMGYIEDPDDWLSVDQGARDA